MARKEKEIRQWYKQNLPEVKVGDIKKLSKFTVPPAIEENQLKNYQITPRESDVAKLLAEGKSYREIAEDLFISLPTVKTHVTRIYEKLNVKNRHELTKLLHNK